MNQTTKNKTKERMPQISIRISPELREKFAKRAKTEGRYLTQQIRHDLMRLVKNEPNEPTDEAPR